MYRRDLPQLVLSTPHNLKNVIILSTNLHRSYFKYSLTLKQKINGYSNFHNVAEKFRLAIKNGKIFNIVQRKLVKVPKNTPTNLLRIWIYQCECVVAQRLRRCQQMFFMYNRIWEERALKEFMRKLRQTLLKRGKSLILGATGVSAFNWEKNQIRLEEMKAHMNDLDYITILKDNTICVACDKSFTKSDTERRVCECGSSKTIRIFDNWELFIRKDDLVVWRRPHDEEGHFEYKVYGSYSEITAEEFLNVQVDLTYRRQWDATAVVLESAEIDPMPDGNSDVIYWEMQWPTLFSNRDYVFVRKYLIDRDANIIILFNKSTEHPSYPKFSQKFRIEDYWSCMVIAPYTTIDKPGLEFSLTYFDNPGVNIPTTITNWVAMRAMPDYLTRLRQATRNYRKYCKNEGVTKACEIIRKEELEKDAEDEEEKLDYCSFIYKKKVPHTLVGKRPKIIEQNGEVVVRNNSDNNTISSDVGSSASNTALQKETNSFWKYFHPTYYFH